jgi:hypothetical protein
MRWHPRGYGGERRSPERVKRDGWHEQGLLAAANVRSPPMAEWTRDLVEERIVEAADVLKQLPPVRVGGYFSTWPEIQRTAKEIAEGMPRPMRLPPPNTAAISRMEEAITWNRFLERDDAHLMWARAEGAPWKELCYRFGISRPTAHRRWEYALSVIVWRLNGRQVRHRWGRRFVVSTAR